LIVHGTEIRICDPRWSDVARNAGLDTYEKIARVELPIFYRASTSHVFHLNPAPEIWPGGVFLKRFFYSSPVRFFLRPAKPYIEYRNYRILQKLGINVPDVLAVGQRRTFGGLVDAFILTAGIENTHTLEQHLRREELTLSPSELTDIFDQLADMVGTMHRHNFFHVDLQCRNVLIQRPSTDPKTPVRVFIIDSPRGGRRWFSPRSWNGRMHDLAGLDKLASLYLSPKDRLKWFKQYAGIQKLNWQDRFLIKQIVRRIESRRHE